MNFIRPMMSAKNFQKISFSKLRFLLFQKILKCKGPKLKKKKKTHFKI